MASKNQKSLNALTRILPTRDQADEFLAELVSDNHRTSALVGCSVIEQALRTLLLSKMPNLTENESDALFYDKHATLASLSSRIEVAYALGAIDSAERDDLNRIRRIRNAFAHSPAPLTFEHELVANECALLTPPPFPKVGEETDNQQLYGGAAVRLFYNLSRRARGASEV